MSRRFAKVRVSEIIHEVLNSCTFIIGVPIIPYVAQQLNTRYREEVNATFVSTGVIHYSLKATLLISSNFIKARTDGSLV